MNKEIKDFIDEKVEQFKSELIKSIEEKEKTKTVWDLEEGDKYFSIYPNGDIIRHTFDNIDFDIRAREIGNMFLTKEDAQFESERRKIEAVFKRYCRHFEYGEKNYYILCVYPEKSIYITSKINTNDGTLYFKSKKAAQKVIDEVGKDRLLKY